MQESNAQLLAINKSDEKNFFQVNFSRNKEKKKRNYESDNRIDLKLSYF